MKKYMPSVLDKKWKFLLAGAMLAPLCLLAGDYCLLGSNPYATARRVTVWTASGLAGPAFTMLLYCIDKYIWGRASVVVAALAAALVAWIWIGGRDCGLPQDDDLVLPAQEESCEVGENAYDVLVDFSCVACEKGNLLRLFIDPDGVMAGACRGIPAARLGEREDERDEKRVNAMYSSGENKISDYINMDSLAMKVARLLVVDSKKEIAQYDRAVAARAYVPPAPETYAEEHPKESCRDGRRKLPLLSLREMSQVIQPARIKLAAMCGEYDKAVALLRGDLELANRICANAGSLEEYVVGRAMADDAIRNAFSLVNNHNLPGPVLSAIDDIVVAAGKDCAGPLVAVLKREYMVQRALLADREKFFANVCPKDSTPTDRIMCYPFYRYAFQPHKMLAAKAKELRDVIAHIQGGEKVQRSAEPGEHADCRSDWSVHVNRALQDSPLRMLALRVQIARKLCGAAGTEEPSIAKIREMLGDCPMSLLGDEVKIDLAAGKVRCGSRVALSNGAVTDVSFDDVMVAERAFVNSLRAAEEALDNFSAGLDVLINFDEAYEGENIN